MKVICRCRECIHNKEEYVETVDAIMSVCGIKTMIAIEANGQCSFKNKKSENKGE